MNAIQCTAKVKSACPKWIPGAPSDEARQVRLPIDHFGGWSPVRPLGLALDGANARPGKTLAAYTNSVTDSLAAAESEVEVGIRRVDDDRSGKFPSRIFNHLSAQIRR